MDKQQWEDPEKWMPERFLDEKYDLAELHKTMSFGAGKRSLPEHARSSWFIAQ